MSFDEGDTLGTRQKLIEKYKSKIYTTDENGQRCFNLRTVRSISVAAGLHGAEITSMYDRNDMCLMINFEAYDCYGIAEKEVESLYNFCKWISTK